MDLNQLSASQKAAIQQLREKVKDCKLPYPDDTYLLRWLIARDFDLAKSEKMLRNALEWRRQHKVDEVAKEFKAPEVLTNYFPAGLVGRDKLLNPLWVVRYGKADLKGILRSAKKKDYITYVVNLVEGCVNLVYKNPQMFKRSPDALIQSCIIFDMDGFSMSHITYKPAMDSAIQLVQIYEANYPELLHRVYVINAPKVFSIAFNLLKPFLHERTKNKIQIFSHDQKAWKAAILADVNPDELPVAYGGTMTDPDGNPNCITKVNMGGEVPKSYYFTGKFDRANKKSLSVSSGSKELLDFEVKKAGAVLKWDFHSEDSDVCFAIYRKQGTELIPIVPSERVDCHLSAEEGQITCEETGTYVVEFDNNFSYLRSKKIWYSVEIE